MNEPGEQEVAIFGAALQMPADQRAVFLEQACAGDAALRERVEAFLADHAEAGAFLDHPAPGAHNFPSAALPSEKPGDRIGRYKLLEQIGEGGCGVVFMAEQEEPVASSRFNSGVISGMAATNFVVMLSLVNLDTEDGLGFDPSSGPGGRWR